MRALSLILITKPNEGHPIILFKNTELPQFDLKLTLIYQLAFYKYKHKVYTQTHHRIASGFLKKFLDEENFRKYT